MNNVGGFLMLVTLAFLAFVGFVIYFIFKELEFVIRAINLYEKMVNRQDAMIKLLMQLRNAALGGQDAQTESDPMVDLRRLESEQDKQPNAKINAIREASKTGNVEAQNGLLLIDAVSAGDEITVRRLLVEGANTEIPTEKGETPLLLACKAQRLDLASLLVKHGANVEGGPYSLTPLDVAVQKGHLDLVKLLVEKGAKVERGFLAKSHENIAKTWKRMDVLDYLKSLPRT